MMNLIKKLRYINQDCLKVIALVTMTMDHIGEILNPAFEDYFRLIGRISFPIFAFLIAFHLSKHDLFKKYIKRLSVFAVLTTVTLIPFGYPSNLNILWTFLVALTTLYGIQYCFNRYHSNTLFKYTLIGIILYTGAVLSIITDYPLFGFFYILTLYGWFKTQRIVFGELCLLLSFLMNAHFNITAGIISSITTFILMAQQTPHHNSKRFLKPWWVFYAYYPFHLVILRILA